MAVACVAGLLALAACQPRFNRTGPGPDRPHHSAAPVTVVLAYGSLGVYLTDADGLTLYLFQPDPPGHSTCTDACAQFWPPLLGAPTAGSGLSQRDLSTTTRDDGSKQVVYRGHPLYYYAGDKKPGQITGQGVNANGGLWYMVDKGGNAITAMPSPPPGN
jgi:predicted lipoprotein with Yx(FWY)xxD motif